MAAYAALTSLMNLIDQINHHPQPPIALDEEQSQSLTEKIAFLKDFLEAYNRHYSNQEVEGLRIRIAHAAYAAEDAIESHIVDQLHSQHRIYKGEDFLSLRDFFEVSGLQSPIAAHEENMRSIELYQNLQKVIKSMDYIKKDVDEIKEKLGTQEQQQGIIIPSVVSPKSHSTQPNIMVGFDDVLNGLLHKLTGQPHSDRQIIPIFGMGGIGKTTLTKNLYTHPLVKQYFDIHAWATISQEYNIREILLEVLLCQKDHGSRESLSHMSVSQLGEKLHKSLYGRKYLIVMDDMWNTDAWDKAKFYFPKNNEGSRIIVTTRLSNVASYLSSGFLHEMDFLDQDNSWSLFCKIVFGEKDCPLQLEKIGMEIVRNCKGLPLSIVVLGGLLVKSKPTREYWARILGNVSSIVNLEESKRCFKILHMSYDELPVHLKVCFLYMAIFPEDDKIYVSKLISMWVAEGFLKPISGKSLEESGEEYLMDLIDRNLISIGERGYFEKIEFCKIHDLLRDLCMREARKERFLFFSNQHDDEGINTERRIVVDKKYLPNLLSTSAAHSLICYFAEDLSFIELRLLRVFKSPYIVPLENRGWIDQQVNLRYFDVDFHRQIPPFSISASVLWNLQTLIIINVDNVVAPTEIWKMPLLRHVECSKLTLSDPPSGDTDEFVLHNLHTLSEVNNLKLGEEVVKRIPNVKKLKLSYEEAPEYEGTLDYCLNNLGHLYKLEYLHCIQSGDDLLPNLIFLHSLKELVLEEMWFSGEEINTKIGSLPHLQALKLWNVGFTTPEWETMEGQFCSLKYLEIENCVGWKCWSTESSHFPHLEHLVLFDVRKLKEIPCDIGNIPTLDSIQLDNCSYSTIISAKEIAEEQEELGNESLRVTVAVYKSKLERGDYEGVESLASHNFQVKIE